MDLNEVMIGSLNAKSGPMPPHVEAAIRAVPREHFVPDGYFVEVEGSGLTAWRPVLPEDAEWREHCYADEALVTQIAGTILPRDMRGVIMREPTSSTSMPGLVAFTLDQADLAPGHRVLELGAGTGWQAGLLSKIVGEDSVFTVETDPSVAAQARTNLHGLGLHPEVVDGDGRDGYPEAAPYDRLLATFGVSRIYPAWLDQMKPGGVVIANLRGRLFPAGLARLVVGGDGTASGRFISEGSYMAARQEVAPRTIDLPDVAGGTTRPTGLDPAELRHNAAKLIAESVTTGGFQWLPGLDIGDGDGPADWFVDQDSGEYAVVRGDGTGFTVTEPDGARFWGAVETVLLPWQSAGRPETTALTVTVDRCGHTIGYA